MTELAEQIDFYLVTQHKPQNNYVKHDKHTVNTDIKNEKLLVV